MFFKQKKDEKCTCHNEFKIKEISISRLTRRVFDLEGYIFQVFHCTGGISGNIPTELSLYDIEKVIQCMRKNLPFSDTTWVKITIPLNLMAHIGGINRFTFVKDYPIPLKSIHGEIGTILNEYFVFLDDARNDHKIEFSLICKDKDYDKKYYLIYSYE